MNYFKIAEISKGLGGGLTNGDHSCAMTNGYDKHDHVPDHFIRYQGMTKICSVWKVIFLNMQ